MVSESTSTTHVLSLRQRAANAAAYARVMREAQAVKETAERQLKVREDFAAEMKRTLQCEIDPVAVKFNLDNQAIITVPDRPYNLTFSFTPAKYHGDVGMLGPFVCLAYFCDECEAWHYSNDIGCLEDLANRIKDIDAWLAGARKPPCCIRREREAAGPAFPTPSQTTEQKLLEALRLYVIEVMESERQEV
jgi:hypothetical protein